MKKAISMLTALAVASTLSLATFAADDTPGTLTRSGDSKPQGIVSYSARVGQSGESGDIVVPKGELFLVDQSDKVVEGVYNKLEPDTEYTFRIYWNPGYSPIETYAADIGEGALVGDDATVIANGKELTGEDIKEGTVRLRTIRGSSNVQSARIKTTGRGDSARYDLVINTRASYGTKINEVEYNLHVTGSKAEAGTFKESSHIFEVGYSTISDEETDIGEGGFITISNDYPVITKEQFVDIAKSVNYKTVNFEAEDGGWMFTGRVSGMGDSNFHYSYDVIPELINKYPDQEYKFLTFNAGVTFPASGEMRIDVSDIYDAFGTKMYAYLYRNGKLTRIDSTYDSGSNEIVFRTNYLGSFVITDTAITDTSIVEDNSESESESEGEPDDNNETGSGNPNTGASPMMNLAMGIGLTTLVTAGALTRRRKK